MRRVRGGGERGSASVEAALVLPLLLLALLGSVQFALVHHAGSVARAAAVEGARLAASEGASQEAGAARARAVLRSGLGGAGAGFTVTVRRLGETVEVRAAGSHRLFIPWVRELSLPVEARAEVRREGFRGGP